MLWNTHRSFRVVTMTQAWFAVVDNSWSLLNGPLWTISALVFAWLVYPYLLPLLTGGFQKTSSKYARQLWGFWMPILAILLQGPALVLISQGRLPGPRLYTTLRTWPPFVLLEFLLGVVTAEVVQHSKLKLSGVLVDIVVISILLAGIFVPVVGSRENFETFWTTGSALAWALVLLCSTAEHATNQSLFVKLASHDAIVKLGEYSFHVYTLQEPVAQLFYGLLHGYPVSRELKFPAGAFLCFVGLVWLCAGCFAELVELPYAAWLRRATTAELAAERTGKS